MSHYHAIISEGTGIADVADLEEIEETMRHCIFHSTLDWQTRDQLKAAAREAWEVVLAMRDPAFMARLDSEMGAAI